MVIINVTCSEIQTPVGFVYLILPVLLNRSNNPGCDQSWYLQDDRLIADPADPHKLLDPAISVSSDRLVTSHCVNLIHEIFCYASDFSHVTAFRVRNQTAVTPNSDDQNEVTPDLQSSDQFQWLLALIIASLLLPLSIFILSSILIYLRLEVEGYPGIW